MRLSTFYFLLFVCLTSQTYSQAPPTVNGETAICSGNPTTLTASGEPGATFAWYDAEMNGNLLATTAQYTTNNLTADTHFYVEQTTSSGTSPLTDVLVNVSPIPSPLIPTNVIASPSTICNGEITNLSATVDSSVDQIVHWYDAEIGGNLIGVSMTGEDFVVMPSESTTFYAQSQLIVEEVIYNYTGSPQTFTVPADVYSLSIDANGAQGGDTYSTLGPGLGGKVEAVMNVVPGQVLHIYVGGNGDSYAGFGSQLLGGWNGGGNGSEGGQGAGGGGATDIRLGGTALSDRILVAGGAGGKGPTCSSSGLKPHGGGLTGGAGSYCNSGPSEYTRGLGGSQTKGGRRGCWWGDWPCGEAGSLGQGGAAASTAGTWRAGGGGGGYYGGGGGINYADGGGGSSYTDSSLSDVVHTQGVNSGNGYLKISYQLQAKDCASTMRVPLSVEVEPVPNVIAAPDIYNCPGNGVIISASGADSYTWEPGALVGQSVMVDPVVTTTYTVTGTTENCSSVDDIIVVVSTLNTSPDTEICIGQSTTLTASGSVNYTWEPGGISGPSITVSPAETTTYSVTASDPSGCLLSEQIVVTVNPVPDLIVTQDTLISKGSSVVLNADGADTYLWLPGSLSDASITVSPEITTEYIVTGTYSSTGCSVSDSVLVSVIDIPKVSGILTILKDSSTLLTATGPTNSTFSWYDADTGGNLLSTSPTFTTGPLSIDTTFYVSLSDGINNSIRLPVNIEVVDANITEASATELTICLNDSTELIAYMNSIGTINWYDADSNGNLIATVQSGIGYQVEPDTTTTYFAEGMTNEIKDTFNYTGAIQTFTIPDGITSINFDAFGAQGGDTHNTMGPGLGGRLEGSMNVIPGQVLNIYIGGVGQSYAGFASQLLGGWNGGGDGSPTGEGGGGGGATDIRINGTALSDRILVAGGAGGKGAYCSASGLKPQGGGLTGGAGSYCNSGSGELKRGLGGSQTKGGRAGCWFNNVACGGVGSIGQGGVGGSVSGNGRAGGGGGGYYGGGGGTYHSDGGGGSSYAHPELHNVIHTQGVREGHGMLILTYSLTSNSNDLIPVTITVGDTISPVVSCKDVSLNLDEQGLVILDANAMILNSFDNCGITNMSISQDSFDCSDIGEIIPVTLTVFDGMNNSASCTSEIMVHDTIPPVAMCKDVTMNLDEQALTTLEATAIDLNSSDNCSIDSMIISQNSFDCSYLEIPTSITLTVYDKDNNSSSCISHVTINDDIYNGQRKVLNPNNDGSNSLRQVITNACPEDIIYFDSNLLNDSIKLESPILLMDKNISIYGLGINSLSISGNNSTRIFQIGTDNNVTIQDLNITEGRHYVYTGIATPSSGTGIDNKGNLILENVVFSGNESWYLYFGVPLYILRTDIVNSEGGLIKVRGEVKIEE